VPSKRRRRRVVRESASQLWKPEERPDYAGPLLLDTHMWVWMLEGDVGRIAGAAIPLIERAAATGALLVCDISFWEVAVKAAKGKLTLSMDAPIWLRRAERAPGVVYVAIDRTILLQSTRLPGAMHGDPADRMLVAAAQLHAAPLVTVDKRIIDYAAAHYGVPVCDVRP
jgi:PIN domain nuclease of toxin-antitoxin system